MIKHLRVMLNHWHQCRKDGFAMLDHTTTTTSTATTSTAIATDETIITATTTATTTEPCSNLVAPTTQWLCVWSLAPQQPLSTHPA